jgi:hypothetical protein
MIPRLEDSSAFAFDFLHGRYPPSATAGSTREQRNALLGQDVKQGLNIIEGNDCVTRNWAPSIRSFCKFAPTF